MLILLLLTVMMKCEIVWQERVVDMVVDKGASVFISGMAGSGKTFVLERIIRMLKSKHGVKFLLILHLAESINHFIIQRSNQSHRLTD